MAKLPVVSVSGRLRGARCEGEGQRFSLERCVLGELSWWLLITSPAPQEPQAHAGQGSAQPHATQAEVQQARGQHDPPPSAVMLVGQQCHPASPQEIKAGLRSPKLLAKHFFFFLRENRLSLPQMRVFTRRHLPVQAAQDPSSPSQRALSTTV